MKKLIVILTGAGISAESGIETFRGNDGLWENHRIECVASQVDLPESCLVQRFYNERRRKLESKEIQPNAAHLALAKLEQSWPGEVLLITQNIDDLHERAGNKNVIHLHGELLKVRCTVSGKIFPRHHDVRESDRCACCLTANPIRPPHVVWFGEMPMRLEEIDRALREMRLVCFNWNIGGEGLSSCRLRI